MLFALGAVSTALDAIQSLASAGKSSSTQKTGAGQGATNPFAIDSGSSIASGSGATSSVNAGNRPQISPETMNALFAAQSQSSTSTGASTSTTSRDAALKSLFSQIDGDGDGQITKTEFQDALGAGGTNLAQAASVFSKLDSNSDGSVSLDEMSKALKSGHGHHAQGASGSSEADGGSDSSSKSGGGSTSKTSTNADGSTTTTVTYADGFKMSTTVPGASKAAATPYDLFAELMRGQGSQGGSSAGSSMSMSV